MKTEIEKIIQELKEAIPVAKKGKNFTNLQAGAYSGLLFAIEKLTQLL